MVYVASWARWDAQWKGLVELERRCQDISREKTNAEQKTRNLPECDIEGKLRVQSRASERMQDQIIEEIKEIEHTKTEEALQLVRKEDDLWTYQNEKAETKRLQGVRKLRKDEEMAWPDWEEATKMENGEWRLEPEGEAEVLDIIIVSDAVDGTFADLDGTSFREGQQDKHNREWKRSRGADRTEMRKEEKRLRCALLNGSA